MVQLPEEIRDLSGPPLGSRPVYGALSAQERMGCVEEIPGILLVLPHFPGSFEHVGDSHQTLALRGNPRHPGYTARR